MDIGSANALQNYTQPLPKAPGAAPTQQFNLPQWQAKSPDAIKKAQAKAAQQYEGVYIAQMLQPMFDTVQTDPEFGGGESEKIYQQMMVQEYGKQIAAKGGMGLAKYMENDLAKLQKQQITGK